jgi:glycosyltransferase involved in cell wall biosynthesis
MTKDKLNVLYLGYSEFPYGYAEFQKLLLISKALVYEGASVKVIGSHSSHNSVRHPGLKKIGHFQGIMYIYSSGKPYRNSNFFKRNIIKPFEKLLESILIFKLNRRDKIDAAIVSTQIFRHLFYYRILSRLLGFKILFNYVEYRSQIVDRTDAKYRLNSYLLDHYAVKISDGVLVISEFLINIIKNINPNKAYLKIPMMVDIDRYTGIVKSSNDKYFVFCGVTTYNEIILFTIKSFELIDNSDTFLYLVVNGSINQLAEIEKRIAISNKSRLIKLISNVSDKELSVLYKNAVGLLIPLRPTIQDEARFPHKFGEYLVSGNPVITTNYGEVKYYFKDMVNALIAKVYEEEAFAEKMNYVITNPSESAVIGENGKKTAFEHADYKKYGVRIINFINELKSNSNSKH